MNAFPFLARLVGPSIYVAVKKKNITFPFNRRLYYCVTLDASLPMKKLVKLLNFFFFIILSVFLLCFDFVPSVIEARCTWLRSYFSNCIPKIIVTSPGCELFCTATNLGYKQRIEFCLSCLNSYPVQTLHLCSNKRIWLTLEVRLIGSQKLQSLKWNSFLVMNVCYK